MRRATRLFATVLVLLVCAACAGRSPWARVPVPSDVRGVALVVDGPAAGRPEVRRSLKQAVERASGRLVVLIDSETSPDDAAVKTLAARLMKANPSIASYDWRKRRCRATGPVLTALAKDVDGVYRVSLQYTERTRPATPEETARREWAATVLHALHIGSGDTVREESVSGIVVMTSFAGTDHPYRVPIARTATRIAPTALTERLDPVAIAGGAIRKLPPLPRPRWDAVARRLTAEGCPFLALALCETRMDGAATRRPLRTAALAAMHSSGRQVMAKPPTAPSSPSQEGAEDTEARETRTLDEMYSCSALCGMHMVEICNKDKSLWNAHGSKWQPTPCGTRRDEDFLADCYRRQWLTGAFHDSCVVPCESTPEGRDRVLGILQTAGCLRLRSSRAHASAWTF